MKLEDAIKKGAIVSLARLSDEPRMHIIYPDRKTTKPLFWLVETDPGSKAFLVYDKEDKDYAVDVLFENGRIDSFSFEPHGLRGRK